MSDNLLEKVNSLGERLKIGGAEVGRKMSAGMSSMSFKVKEFFQSPNHADKLVDEATSDSLDEPNWAMNLHICDLINAEELSTGESVRAIKRRIMMRSPRIQYLALVLLEALLKNCDNKGFMEVATERVLDEMVKLINDPQTIGANRDKALMMIEAWGESTTQLRFLPVYEETYKSLKSRGFRFPCRDNESLAPIFTPPCSASAPDADVFLQQPPTVQSLITSEQTKEAFDVARNSIELLYTVLSSSPQQDVLQDELSKTLVQQCRGCQSTIQRIVESAAGDNEALLFEALNVNDEIQKVLSKYQELSMHTTTTTSTTRRCVPVQPEPPMLPVAVEPEESPRLSEEQDALIRKPASGSRAGAGVVVSHEDMMDDLDEMIFGKKSGGGGAAADGDGDASHSHVGHGQDQNKKQSSSKHDLISF